MISGSGECSRRPGADGHMLERIFVPVRWTVHGMTAVAAAGIVAMMAVTVVDVIARSALNRPLPGAYDLVRLIGGLALFCSLPYTTAVKGHVAVEFLFHKLGGRGRILVDVFNRLLGIALFSCLTAYLTFRGLALRASGEVTPTLQLPMYPVVFAGAFACAVVAAVILHNLLHPGREMIRP